MALFHDVVFSEATGRHDLHFVNQQYDYLGCISFDPATGELVFDPSEEEARALWGSQLDEVIAYARTELPEADRRRALGRSGDRPGATKHP